MIDSNKPNLPLLLERDIFLYESNNLTLTSFEESTMESVKDLTQLGAEVLFVRNICPELHRMWFNINEFFAYEKSVFQNEYLLMTILDFDCPCMIFDSFNLEEVGTSLGL